MKKVLKWLLIGFGAFIGLIIVLAVAIGSTVDTTETTKETTEKKIPVSSEVVPETKEEPKKEAAEEVAKEVKVAGIGEVVSVGGVEFTVNSISTATNVGGEYGVDAQGTFLLIDTTVKNVGNEAITTDSSFFKLLSGEKTYEADGSAGIYANPDTNFFLEQVNPDLSATGLVVFDVSDEVIANPELLLQVQTGFFGTETGTIKISK